MHANTALPWLWDHYVLNGPTGFDSFWRDFLSDNRRRVLFVLGQGFDPRMCVGMETILKGGEVAAADVLMIEFPEGDDSPSRQHHDLVIANVDRLKLLVAARGATMRPHKLAMWSTDKRRIASISAAQVFADPSTVRNYTDIVCDISAMPRGIYFPIIRSLLSLCCNWSISGGEPRPNLHVVVAESVSVDQHIQDEGLDESASYMSGLGLSIELESMKDMPKIWIPVLGENQALQLDKISRHVNPRQVCPVIPFPARDPRRGDSLLLSPEYCRLFFEHFAIDPRDILYADERNPFQVYRQIRMTVQRYAQTFALLGGCRVVLSALSSKLLSLGVLLTAFDLHRHGIPVGIAHVDTRGYILTTPEASATAGSEHAMYHLWLHGDCYDEQ